MKNTEQRTNWTLPVVMVPMATVAVFLILLGLSVSGFHDKRLDNGAVELADVDMQLQGNQLQLTASAEISLPSALQTGLENGVPLTFVLQLRLVEPVRFWFDTTLQRFERRYTLTYYELTRHYRVDALDTHKSRNYRSLSSALAGLGQLDQLQFVLSDAYLETPLGSPTDVSAALTLSLDTSALPLPMQPLMKSSWSVASEEYQWPVI